MAQTSSGIRRAFIVALFIIPIAFLAFRIVSNPKRTSRLAEEEKVAASNIVQHLAPVLERWKSGVFYPIDDSQAFRDQLAHLAITNSSQTRLSDHQADKLRETMLDFLLAYHLGTFEAFEKFRAPVAEFHLRDSIVEFMKDDLGKQNIPVPDSQSAMLELYWRKYVGDEFVGFWSALEFSESSVEVTQMSTSTPSLAEYAKARENGGIATAGPMLTFDSSASGPSGGALLATIRVLVKNSDVTCPVYCRFFWDGGHDKWLPVEQVAAYAGPRKKTLMF